MAKETYGAKIHPEQVKFFQDLAKSLGLTGEQFLDALYRAWKAQEDRIALEKAHIELKQFRGNSDKTEKIIIGLIESRNDACSRYEAQLQLADARLKEAHIQFLDAKKDFSTQLQLVKSEAASDHQEVELQRVALEKERKEVAEIKALLQTEASQRNAMQAQVTQVSDMLQKDLEAERIRSRDLAEELSRLRHVAEANVELRQRVSILEAAAQSAATEFDTQRNTLLNRLQEAYQENQSLRKMLSPDPDPDPDPNPSPVRKSPIATKK